jgi:hypothetical protein
MLAAAAGAEDLVEYQSFSATEGRFGVSVSHLGDVNGDGYGDLIIGSERDSNGGTKQGCGLAVVVSGKDGSTLYTYRGSAQDDRLGRFVSHAGDVNADGCGDFMISVPYDDTVGTNSGRVIVCSGSTGKALHTFYGLEAKELCGWGIGDAGDLDDDGYDDVIVGSPMYTGSGNASVGMARVFSGKDGTTLLTLRGSTDYGEFGAAVHGLPDVDGDGVVDFVIGQPGTVSSNTWTKGAVHVVSGVDGKTLYTIDGERVHDWTAHAVDSTGDVDGDGSPDFIIGTPGYDYKGLDAGRVQVLSGKDGTVLYTYLGAKAYFGCGESVSGIGDIDADGYADFAFGAAFGDDGSTVGTGSVTVCSGQTGDVLWTLYGEATSDQFGFSVCGHGDTNGDDIPDLVIGAKVANKVYVFGLPGPTGTLAINSGDLATASRSVELALTCDASEAEHAEMRLRNEGTDWGDWEPLVAKKSWGLPSEEGLKTVEVQFREGPRVSTSPVEGSILLDQTPPSVEIVIAGGADWVNTARVDVELPFSDAVSGVSHLRLRNGEEDFGPWFEAADLVSFDLLPGDGPKAVEVQAKDHAGNLSEVSADAVGLDQTPPSGSIVVADGADYVGLREVELRVTAEDEGGSGLAEMRFHNGPTGEWEPWRPFAELADWVLPAGDGTKTVLAMFRDGAGNVSTTGSGSVSLDRTGPTIDALLVNDGRPYVLPEEPVQLRVTARDNPLGCGVAAFRFSAGGGADWGEWGPFPADGIVPGTRPPTAGRIAIRGMARDFVGNSSMVFDAPATYFVEADVPLLGTGGKISGTMSDRQDLDAFELTLVKGDILSIRVKAAAEEKGRVLPLVLDLARPEGERLIEEIFAPGCPTFVVPETGRYLLILREDGEGVERGAYSLSVSVKPSKTNSKGKGVVTTGEVAFEAAAGSLLKASLKGPGLDPGSVRVTGPDGAVDGAAAGKPGSAKLATTLDRGTGTYVLSFEAGGPVSVSWGTKRARASTLVEE